MRKLIATLSLGLSLVFAFALANASDEESVTKKETTDKTVSLFDPQQPGTAESRSMEQSRTLEQGKLDQRSAASPDTCKDEAGTVFKKTEKGYNTCLKSLEKTKRSEQITGEIESSTHEASKHETSRSLPQS